VLEQRWPQALLTAAGGIEPSHQLTVTCRGGACWAPSGHRADQDRHHADDHCAGYVRLPRATAGPVLISAGSTIWRTRRKC
jgi:hypothetical protein